MGLQAAGAILDPLLRISKAAAAPVTQRIQRTIAEQTAEAITIRPLMAGKIFTFPILEKIIIRHSDPPICKARKLCYNDT